MRDHTYAYAMLMLMLCYAVLCSAMFMLASSSFERLLGSIWQVFFNNLESFGSCLEEFAAEIGFGILLGLLGCFSGPSGEPFGEIREGFCKDLGRILEGFLEGVRSFGWYLEGTCDRKPFMIHFC